MPLRKTLLISLCVTVGFNRLANAQTKAPRDTRARVTVVIQLERVQPVCVPDWRQTKTVG